MGGHRWPGGQEWSPGLGLSLGKSIGEARWSETELALNQGVPPFSSECAIPEGLASLQVPAWLCPSIPPEASQSGTSEQACKGCQQQKDLLYKVKEFTPVCCVSQGIYNR